MSLMMASRCSAAVGDLGQPIDLLLGSAASAAQQVRQADDRVHRRADLVAHVGQEGALGAVGRLGLTRASRQFQRSASHQFLEVMAVPVEFLAERASSR